METINKHNPQEELDVKSILIQLAFGAFAGLAFIAICGIAELINDYFCGRL